MKRDLQAGAAAPEISVPVPMFVSLVDRALNLSGALVPGVLGALVPGVLVEGITEAPSVRLDALPAIGDEWEAGIYVGLTLHEGRPHALVLLEEDRADLSWADAKAFAEKQGGVLPSRIDMLVLLANARDRFKKDDYYWTSEQYASDSSYAWIQGFSDGGQYYRHPSAQCRARAVRRVVIR